MYMAVGTTSVLCLDAFFCILVTLFHLNVLIGKLFPHVVVLKYVALEGLVLGLIHFGVFCLLCRESQQAEVVCL